MKNNLLISLIVLGLIAIGVYFAMNKNQSTAPVTISVSPTTSRGENPTSAVKEIVVTGRNFKFTPDTITVKKGEKTRLIFKSVDGAHDFRVDELGIATELTAANKESVVEFIADKTGSFEFYCSVGNHRQMGMKGTLIVNE